MSFSEARGVGRRPGPEGRAERRAHRDENLWVRF